MTTPPRPAAGRLLRLLALYAAQGIPFGFATLYVPLQIAGREDFSYGKATLVTLASFPWILKALWAPAADSWWWPRIGRRRSWVLPAQALLCLTAFLCAGVRFDGALVPVFAAVALLNLWASVQDAAVDGLAVESLAPHERGLGNVAQVAGYKLGMVFGGSGLVFVAERAGTPAAMWTMAGSIALLMLVPLTYREGPPPARTSEVSGSPVGALRLLGTLLRGRGWAATIAFIATVKVGETMASNLVKPFLVEEAGFTREDASVAIGTVALVASLCGSLLGGWLAGRMPRVRAIVTFGTLQAFALCGLALAMFTSAEGSTLIAVITLEHFAAGMLTPALFAYMMDVTEPAVAATHYTVLATAEVLLKGIGGGVVGFFADAWGAPAVVLLAGTVGAIPLLLARVVRKPALSSHSVAVAVAPSA